MLAMLPVLGTIGLVLGLGVAVGSGSEHVSAIFVAMIAGLIVSSVAKRVANDQDRLWLPKFILAGFTAKLLASWLRWWVLVDYYHGSGDATGYHGAGIRNAELWQSFTPPPMGVGTEAMDGVSGLVYAVYEPNFLGGFFMFATLAFFGQIFFYSAFRKSVVPRRLKLYALGVFFVPNIVYWPSSIGKESVMMLGLGMASYGVAKLLTDASVRALPALGVGLLIGGIIRPHVAAGVAVAAVVALLFAKGGGIAKYPFKRLVMLSVVGLVLAAALIVAAANFGITLQDASAIEGQVDSVLENVQDNTAKGGSSVTGSFISSPAQFPEAAMRVLFRPLPNEAHNPPAQASSLEGLVLLLIMVWKLPAMLKRGLKIRRDPYMIFCLVFTIGFIIAFSSFLNLGLMARERSQVMPYLIALLVGLGFGPPPDEEPEEAEPAAHAGIQGLLAGAPDIDPAAPEAGAVATV